jgi:hypothetical protein
MRDYNSSTLVPPHVSSRGRMCWPRWGSEVYCSSLTTLTVNQGRALMPSVWTQASALNLHPISTCRWQRSSKHL